MPVKVRPQPLCLQRSLKAMSLGSSIGAKSIRDGRVRLPIFIYGNGKFLF